MDIIQNLNLADGLVIAFATAIIGMLVQLIKKYTNIGSNALPFVSAGIGIVVGIIAVFYYKETNYIGGGLTGMIIGLIASGAFSAVKSGTSLVSDKVSTSKDAKKKARQDEINKAVADALASEKLKAAEATNVPEMPTKPVAE